MSATKSSIAYVERNGQVPGFPCSCPGGGSMEVFRSVWDRLCRQLFDKTPPSMDTEDILPDVDLWKGGVVMVDDGKYPYTFRVFCEDEDTPKPSDILEYRGRFYIIGEVDN